MSAGGLDTLLAPRSLRTRLLGLVLACLLVGVVAVAAGAYRGALREADAMNDLHLQQVAQSLRSNMPMGNFGGLDESAAVDLLVQIWGPDGAQIYRSARARLPQHAVLGFSDVAVEGTRYRVYSIQTPLQTVQIAQDMDARLHNAQAQALRATLPVLVTGPLLMLAIAWIIARTLAPVERVRRQLSGRAAGELQPLPDADLPDEVRPLVQEMNLLFGRVRGAFETQRQFVADAAHELRSPLTALKLQVQALRRAPAGDAAAHDAAVARLGQGIDRAIDLVGQLLALARQDSGAGGAAEAAAPVPVDLHGVVQATITELLPQAAARRIDLGVAHADEGATVRGWPEGLHTLLRNLLDNALKYTPEGGQVDVELRHTPGGAVTLVVEDSGPGIAEENRQRVFDRFFREAGTTATGSGLGLAIVKAVAERHGATVALDRSPRLGGLRAAVAFPGSTA